VRVTLRLDLDALCLGLEVALSKHVKALVNWFQGVVLHLDPGLDDQLLWFLCRFLVWLALDKE